MKLTRPSPSDSVTNSPIYYLVKVLNISLQVLSPIVSPLNSLVSSVVLFLLNILRATNVLNFSCYKIEQMGHAPKLFSDKRQRIRNLWNIEHLYTHAVFSKYASFRLLSRFCLPKSHYFFLFFQVFVNYSNTKKILIIS